MMEPTKTMHADVAIAGASFAGLGVAHFLKDAGLDVLLIDRKGIGEQRTSACGVPTYVAENMAPDSILHSVKRFSFETPTLKRNVDLHEEYCALDYHAFCTDVFRKSGARFLDAEVTGASDGVVRTSKGDVAARLIVDCTGWKRVLGKTHPRQKMIAAIEITVPIAKKYEESLNFFLYKDILPGYGWIFPVGSGLARVGAGGPISGAQLSRAFLSFLGRTGITFNRNELIGGAIPCTGIGTPVEDGIFFVGDSAKAVLPLTAEGIRTSLYFAKQCAYSLRSVAGGRMTPKEGQDFYFGKVRETAAAFSALAMLQGVTVASPQPLVDAGLFLVTSKPLQGRLMRAYSSIARL
jgi:flavin-dependent dehydrogenase